MAANGRNARAMLVAAAALALVAAAVVLLRSLDVGGEPAAEREPIVSGPSAHEADRAPTNGPTPAASRPIDARPFDDALDPAGASVPVRVVDGEGRPAAGVPVFLVSKAPDGKLKLWESGITRAEDGIARIQIPDSSPGDDGLAWFVTADVQLDGTGESVDVREPPREPVVIRLGPVGRVVVRVVDDSNNLVSGLPVRVLLRVHRPGVPDGAHSGGPPAALERTVTSGEAAFDHVGVGTQIWAHVEVPGIRRRPAAESAGPRHAGDTVTVDVFVAIVRPLVTGRLLDPAGSPVRKEFVHSVTARVPGEPNGNLSGFTTDADGRFAVEIFTRLPEGGRRTLELRLGKNPHQADAKAVVDLSRELPLGATDVGDVVLVAQGPAPLIVSGVVLGDGDRPVPGAILQLHGLATRYPSGRERWDFLSTQNIGSPTDDGGRFEVRLLSECVTFKISADVRGCWSEDPVVFTRGATDVVLRVHKGGALKGSLRLPEGVRRSELTVTVRSADRAGDRPAIKRDNTFEIDGLAPGPYTLSVGHEFERIKDLTFFRVDGVQVRAGETNCDPRIQNIEVVAPRKVVLTVVNPEGEPVLNPEASELHLSTRGTDAVDDVFFGRAADGRIPILLRQPPFDVVVGAAGYRRVILRSVETDRRVVLQPGLPIRVVYDGATLEGVEGVAMECVVMLAAARAPDLHAESIPGRRSSERFDTRTRSASVRVAEPGDYYAEVRLSLRTEAGNLIRPFPLASRSITVTDTDAEQTFEIVVPSEVLERRLRELRKR